MANRIKINDWTKVRVPLPATFQNRNVSRTSSGETWGRMAEIRRKLAETWKKDGRNTGKGSRNARKDVAETRGTVAENMGKDGRHARRLARRAITQPFHAGNITHRHRYIFGRAEKPSPSSSSAAAEPFFHSAGKKSGRNGRTKTTVGNCRRQDTARAR